jgi:hypothetical protein
VKHLILFFVLFSFVFGEAENTAVKDVVLTGDIELTQENIDDAFKVEFPNWVQAFDKEISDHSYEYESGQASLEVLRATKLGNCVAFAKLAAYHALRAGYECRLISIADKQGAHMFLYASSDKNSWAVSVKTYRPVNSIKDSIFRMNALGSKITRESYVTLNDLGGQELGTILPNGRTISDSHGEFKDNDSRESEYNLSR